jgi:hypothetical protein
LQVREAQAVREVLHVDAETRRLAKAVSKEHRVSCRRTCATPPDPTVQEMLSAINRSTLKALADQEDAREQVSFLHCLFAFILPSKSALFGCSDHS